MLRSTVEHWRGAFRRMFVRFRDQLRADVQSGRHPLLSQAAIDGIAAAQAERSIKRAMVEVREAEQRLKARRGEAA